MSHQDSGVWFLYAQLETGVHDLCFVSSIFYARHEPKGILALMEFQRQTDPVNDQTILSKDVQVDGSFHFQDVPAVRVDRAFVQSRV